jgi:hypothetical protein
MGRELSVRFGAHSWPKQPPRSVDCSTAADPSQSPNRRAGDPESGHLLTEIEDGSAPISFRHF